MGIFSKIKEGLKKTRDSVIGQIGSMLKSFTKIDEELFEELEELLVMGDVGVQTAEEICDKVKAKVKETGTTDPGEIQNLLEEVVSEMLKGGQELNLNTNPSVILVIGVNGVGKTTTIGKMAYQFKNEGKKVLLAAADTFRAAAIDQLQIWADRSGCDIIKQNEGSDPAAVVYDAISAAKARGADIIIADTAGRLHNKKHLMDELAKINRIIDRELPDADKEVLLVLDATTGQNAVSQVEHFKEATGITGIVLTKLDGTAKGGIVLAIKNTLDVPVKYIGVGEQIDDLQPFDPQLFAESLFDEIPENYKKKEDEVLPVYEQPLEIPKHDESTDLAEEFRQAFEELSEALVGDEDDGQPSVSDDDDERAYTAEGEYTGGAEAAVLAGYERDKVAQGTSEEAPRSSESEESVEPQLAEVGPDDTADNAQEEESVVEEADKEAEQTGVQTGSSAPNGDNEAPADNDLYGSIGKFYF